ncbi:MAG TPA: hypothetical protein VN641_11520, partial [Urbifossiella sp.]|nr:hypothetical protein [Urbifossiella sp.]
MRRSNVRIALCLFAGLTAAGCGHFSRRSSSSRPAPASAVLPTMPRGTVAPDLSALPVETGGKPPTRPGEYRKLPTAECRTLAIENAPFAKDLDEHSENQAPNHPRFHPLKPKPNEAELGRRARGYLADDFRNKAAGDALDDFYQLAQSEGQFDLLAKSLGELRARLADAEEALKRGLADRSNVDALRVQVLDMEAKIAQLEAGIGAL